MEITTKLDKLYSLREEFSIIGVTGRTGSGCTDVADILASDFLNLKNIPKPKEISESGLERKYQIVYDFNNLNWKKYSIIKYKDILLFLLLQSVEIKTFRVHLENYYRIWEENFDTEKIEKTHKELHAIFVHHSTLINEIKSFGDIRFIKDRTILEKLAALYWNNFEPFASSIDDVLRTNGIVERTFLLHKTAINFRKSGQAYKTDIENYDYIYYIAEVINRIIKGTKILKGKYNHVVIDSLRNSLEINFFKERYSSFYLVAVKSDDRKNRLIETYGKDKFETVDQLLDLDDTEYKCTDFAKGKFFSPDVQNCIQKADFHITNSTVHANEYFDSVEQQLLRFQGLIQQPGLITPSAIERCMQIAYNSKLSSGCISRQVGAVVTDRDFSIKSVGWNDIPRGAVPCSLRNIKELSSEKPFGFSDFELGIGLVEKVQDKHTLLEANNNLPNNPDNADLDKESKKFNAFLKETFTEEKFNEKALGGINCPYCFKTAYNTFKGESNQVHTRSLHAEENAMMQIAKYGGQPLKNGYLFTTASPCELCSKKAFQLGITNIFYIDPYPGISRSHILRQSVTDNPTLTMFSGAIGRGYLKLYEPFMAQKDEISILTSHEMITPKTVKIKQLKNIFKEKIKNNPTLKEKLDSVLKDEDNFLENIIELLEKGIDSNPSEQIIKCTRSSSQ